MIGKLSYLNYLLIRNDRRPPARRSTALPHRKIFLTPRVVTGIPYDFGPEGEWPEGKRNDFYYQAAARAYYAGRSLEWHKGLKAKAKRSGLREREIEATRKQALDEAIGWHAKYDRPLPPMGTIADDDPDHIPTTKYYTPANQLKLWD